MASFRRGAEAAVAAAQSTGSGKFKPVFNFESPSTTYLQFLTSWDEVPTVLMHQFITVGFREDGKPKYERFISRRDPALDGPDGYDELIDRFGSAPTARNIAIAVELEPQYKMNGTKKVLDGWEVVEREYTTKDDETKTVPNIFLVIESPHTLFGHLAAIDDVKPIEESIFAIKVSGKGTDKTFTPIEAAPALDFGDEFDAFLEELDFEGWLEEISSEDRMKELISPLPDDFVVNKYAKLKGKAKKETSARSTRTRREEVEEPEVDESGTDEDAPAEAAPAGRSRRFQQLRQESAKKA